jgi:hypothetical protein
LGGCETRREKVRKLYKVATAITPYRAKSIFSPLWGLSFQEIQSSSSPLPVSNSSLFWSLAQKYLGSHSIIFRNLIGARVVPDVPTVVRTT